MVKEQLNISLHKTGDLRRLLAGGEEDEICAHTVAEVGKAGTFTDNVIEAASWVGAEPTA